MITPGMRRSGDGKTHGHAVIVIGGDGGAVEVAAAFFAVDNHPRRLFFHLGAQFAQFTDHRRQAGRIP